MFKGYARTFPKDEGGRNGEVGKAQLTRHPFLVGQVFIENRQELRDVLERTLQRLFVRLAHTELGFEKSLERNALHRRTEMDSLPVGPFVQHGALSLILRIKPPFRFQASKIGV